MQCRSTSRQRTSISSTSGCHFANGCFRIPTRNTRKASGSGDSEMDHREHPNWHTSRRAVCDFIGACLQDEVDVPISARQRLAGLLDMLCTQSDWHLDQDKRTILNRDDQLTEAINTTRGRALENLVNFGFWVRRHDDKAEVLEIKATLEKKVQFGSRVSADASGVRYPGHALWFDFRS